MQKNALFIFFFSFNFSLFYFCLLGENGKKGGWEKKYGTVWMSYVDVFAYLDASDVARPWGHG